MKTRTRNLVKRVLGEEPMTTAQIYQAIKNTDSLSQHGDKRPRRNMPSMQELSSILGKAPEFERVTDKGISPAEWIYKGEL